MNSSTSGSANANANADLNAGAGFYGPGASQFKNIDSDADGRISRAEFTAAGSAATSLTSGSSTTTGTTADAAAGKTEKKHWWNRSSSSDKASGDMDPSETFSKLDTDNDGFLSQSELANANAKLKK
jgi:hypothetical protein